MSAQSTFAALLALTISTGLASADGVSVRDAKHYYQLELPGTFAREAAPPRIDSTTTILATYRSTHTHAVVVHARFPNRRAWAGRREFFREVAAGVRDASGDYRELRRRTGRLGRVPFLDLSFRRTKGAAKTEVHSRHLFFRTFTVSIAFETNAKTQARRRRANRRARDSFKPYFK